MLLGGILVLDYPHQRFTLASDFPQGIANRFSWTPAAIRQGWLFTTIKVNDEIRQDFFFDTGASFFSLSVDKNLWQALTGRVGKDDVTDNRLTPTWNGNEHLLGAPIKGTLEIGPVQIQHPLAYYRQEQPDWFKAVPGTAGLFGNAPFLSRVVAIDLRKHPRFGVF